MLSSYEYGLQEKYIAPYFIKTYENWCPYDNLLYSACGRIAKLNKETLGKIKNTSKNDRRACQFLLKFGQ